METRILKIDEDTKLDRLDKILAEKLDFSRKRIKDLLDEGNVLVNQKVMKASYKVCVGDEIAVSIPELDSTEVLPEPIDLDIVYEDHDIIVINKPKGMVVHPAPGHYSGTLVNALLYHCKDLSGINGVMRPGIVHRIDKDTSGLLVVAKNDVAHESLSQQLQDKTCHREYVAIVHNPLRTSMARFMLQLVVMKRIVRKWRLPQIIRRMRLRILQYWKTSRNLRISSVS